MYRIVQPAAVAEKLLTELRLMERRLGCAAVQRKHPRGLKSIYICKSGSGSDAGTCQASLSWLVVGLHNLTTVLEDPHLNTL